MTRTTRRTALALLLPLLLLGLLAPPASAATQAPGVPAASGEGRRIVYSGGAQRVWLVAEDGTVDRTYRVSGKRGTPRPGTYRVFSKSEKAFSTGGVTMRWMVRFTRGSRLAIGFHDIPRSRSGRPLQSEAQLGTYRSHGCVRQSTADARALYDWAPLGTTVVVVR